MTLLLSFYLTNNADRMPSFVKEMLLYNVYFFSCLGWSWGTRRRASGWTGPRSPTSGGTSFARLKLWISDEMSSLSRWGLKVTLYLFFSSFLSLTLFEWGLKLNKHGKIDSKGNRESSNSDSQLKKGYGKHQLQLKSDMKICSGPIY